MIAPRLSAVVLLAAASLTAAGGASAASVDLRGNGGWNAGPLDVTFTDGTTATATAESTRKTRYTPKLGQWNNGLGVYNGRGDSHQVDGFGSTDSVWFDFSTAFHLTGVELSYVSSHRNEKLRVLDGDGNTLGNFEVRADSGSSVAIVDLLGVGDVAHERIGLAAIGSKSAFKIRGLQGVSAVPTPTAAAAGVALLLGGAMRRRRSEAV